MKRTVVIRFDVETDDEEKLCNIVRVVAGQIMHRTMRDGTRVGDVAATLLVREPQAQPVTTP